VTAAPVANPTKVPTKVPTNVPTASPFSAPTQSPAPTTAVEIPAITDNDNDNNNVNDDGNNSPTDSDSGSAIQQTDPNDPSTRGLTGGAYAGIAIGAAAVGTFLLYFLMSRTDGQNEEDVVDEDLDADLERMEHQEVVKNYKNANSRRNGRPPLSIDTADDRGKTETHHDDDDARGEHSPSNQSHDHTAATAAMTASPSQLNSVPSSSDSISTNPNYHRVGAAGSSNYAMPSLLGRPDDQSVLSHSDYEDQFYFDSNSHHRGTTRGVNDTMSSEEVASDAESRVGGSSTGDGTSASGSASGSDDNGYATRVKESTTGLAAMGVATAAVTGLRHPYSSAGGIYEEDEEDERYIGIGGRDGQIGNNSNSTNDSTDEDSSIASMSVSSSVLMDNALANPNNHINNHGPSLPPQTYTPGDMDQAIEQGNWEALAAGAAAVINHDNNNNNNIGKWKE